MAKFLSGAALCYALEEVLQQAQEEIVLISPYVKLHPLLWKLNANLPSSRENIKLYSTKDNGLLYSHGRIYSF